MYIILGDSQMKILVGLPRQRYKSLERTLKEIIGIPLDVSFQTPCPIPLHNMIYQDTSCFLWSNTHPVIEKLVYKTFKSVRQKIHCEKPRYLYPL